MGRYMDAERTNFTSATWLSRASSNRVLLNSTACLRHRSHTHTHTPILRLVLRLSNDRAQCEKICTDVERLYAENVITPVTYFSAPSTPPTSRYSREIIQEGCSDFFQSIWDQWMLVRLDVDHGSSFSCSRRWWTVRYSLCRRNLLRDQPFKWWQQMLRFENYVWDRFLLPCVTLLPLKNKNTVVQQSMRRLPNHRGPSHLIKLFTLSWLTRTFIPQIKALRQKFLKSLLPWQSNNGP